MARRDETTDGMRISLAETEVQTQNVPVGILKEWDATRHLFSKVRWVKTPDPGVRRLKLRK
jgi:hypothetical protein